MNANKGVIMLDWHLLGVLEGTLVNNKKYCSFFCVRKFNFHEKSRRPGDEVEFGKSPENYWRNGIF